MQMYVFTVLKKNNLAQFKHHNWPDSDDVTTLLCIQVEMDLFPKHLWEFSQDIFCHFAVLNTNIILTEMIILLRQVTGPLYSNLSRLLETHTFSIVHLYAKASSWCLFSTAT